MKNEDLFKYFDSRFKDINKKLDYIQKTNTKQYIAIAFIFGLVAFGLFEYERKTKNFNFNPVTNIQAENNNSNSNTSQLDNKASSMAKNDTNISKTDKKGLFNR